MRIAWVYTTGRPAGWVDRAFEGAALGGSEASMILYAQEFARLGHEVTIFTPSMARTRTLGGVTWRDFWGIHGHEFDVAIALRFPDALTAVLAPVRVVYCCDPEVPKLPDFYRTGNLQLVVTISEHQKDRFQQEHPIPEELYMVSNAGITYSDYVGKGIDKVRGRCIYCSVPARGLYSLAELWPAIRKKVPWATLHITGGFELWGMDIPIAKQPALEKIIGLEGVTYLGVLPREELIREQLESEVLLLPGAVDSPEMCCISAMECAAAGNALIVTDVGALPERVQHGATGALVSRAGRRWEGPFAECAVETLLTSGLPQMQVQAREGEVGHDYSILAPQWIARFEEVLNG